MKELSIEWHSNKATENFKKHGVTFKEAQTVFFDDYAVEFYDDEHSEWEDRFLLLGLSAKFAFADGLSFLSWTWTNY